MRKLTIALLTAVIVGAGTFGPMPVREARADDCIESCDADFPGGSPIKVAMRGWCYIVRCYVIT